RQLEVGVGAVLVHRPQDLVCRLARRVCPAGPLGRGLGRALPRARPTARPAPSVPGATSAVARLRPASPAVTSAAPSAPALLTHSNRSPGSGRTPRAQSGAAMAFLPFGWTSPRRTGTVPVPTS